MNGWNSNTVKSNIVDKIKGVSEVDPGLKFSTSDFEEEVDSAIMVRERTRGSKLESQFRKRAGKIVKETIHTITFLPKDGKKRDCILKAGCSENKTAKEEQSQTQKTNKLDRPQDGMKQKSRRKTKHM